MPVRGGPNWKTRRNRRREAWPGKVAKENAMYDADQARKAGGRDIHWSSIVMTHYGAARASCLGCGERIAEGEAALCRRTTGPTMPAPCYHYFHPQCKPEGG